jgi:ABC-type molybdate transport system substrate-binding protein
MSKLILLLILSGLVMLSGCSTQTSSRVAESVRVNAAAALKECGEGNVKKVTSTGFECSIN